MIDMLPRFADPVDVGDTRKELITLINPIIKFLATRPYGPAMQALVSEIATQPELARVYREQVVEARRAQLAPVIERGIARGDFRPETDSYTTSCSVRPSTDCYCAAPHQTAI